MLWAKEEAKRETKIRIFFYFDDFSKIEEMRGFTNIWKFSHRQSNRQLHLFVELQKKQRRTLRQREKNGIILRNF